MCGSLISSIFGGNRSQPAPPPTPAPPTPPPAPQMVQRAPVEPPATPTPAPMQEDETKRKAKITSKKVQKKARSAGTSQLATKKPATGGLQGINTPQGTNTGTNAGTGTATTTTKKTY